MIDHNSIFSKFTNISWIKDHTICFVRSGSMSYGTNIATSDEDFKGVAIPPKEYFFGTKNTFEQAELKAPNPDTTIYEIRKFIKLASVCNPNVLEMLFVDEQDILYSNSLGNVLFENRELFLSKKIKHTMIGYAISQLKRIRSHRSYLLNPPTVKPTRIDFGLPDQTLIPKDQLLAAQAEINKELDKLNFNLDELDEPTKINIRAAICEVLAELKITSDHQWMSAARKIGLSDNFIELMNKERRYTQSKKDWDQYQEWSKNRNPTRAALEAKFGYDCKFAYHLVRLVRMCKEVLTTGKMLVKRPDREELIAIRQGLWTYDQLIDFAEHEEEEINKLYVTSKLQHSPDQDKLNEICINLIEESLKNA